MVNPKFLIESFEELYNNPTDELKLEMIQLICCTDSEELQESLGITFENAVRTINRPSSFLIDFMKSNYEENKSE